jgi:threonine/homoserine/homoserine lactone efflux protein
MSFGTLVNGYILGWSVAWPPGPVNAEMIRRTLLPKERGGGFWSAWPIGLGACSGDFIWALCVSAGAGALLNAPAVRRTLACVSLALLLFLAGMFAARAWKIFKAHRSADTSHPEFARRNGYFVGLVLVLTSPWSIGFWLAVVGSQATHQSGFAHSLALASSVVFGALSWTLVLCAAVKLGAKVFARPVWQIATQAITAVLMLWFAVRLLMHFP